MKEILGEGLKKAMQDLGLKAIMAYKGKEYEVWKLEDEDYKVINEYPDEEWKDDWGWWISCEGSVLGEVNTNIKIANQEIKAWIDHEKYKTDYEGEEIEGCSFDEYLKKEFCSLTEYMEIEMGASKEENICALAMDLAKANQMTLSELFDKYEGGNQIKIENWVSEVDPFDDEYWHPDFEGNSKEEVVKATEDYINENNMGYCTYRIGKQINSTFPLLDYDSVENILADKAYDEVGEISGDFLSGVTKEQRKELEDGLNDVIVKWLDKHNLDPQYFLVTNIEEVEINK